MGEVGVPQRTRETIRCHSLELLFTKIHVVCINASIPSEDIANISVEFEKEGIAVVGLDIEVSPCKLAQAYLYARELEASKRVRRPSLAVLAYVKGERQIAPAIESIKRQGITRICIVAPGEDSCVKALRRLGLGGSIAVLEGECSKEELSTLSRLHVNSL